MKNSVVVFVPKFINTYCRVTVEREDLNTMSARRNQVTEVDKHVVKLRSELESLKAQTKAVDAAHIASNNVHSHEFDQLTPTEQSAASLGVNPTAWKPIAFLNNAHYSQLIKVRSCTHGSYKPPLLRVDLRLTALFYLCCGRRQTCWTMDLLVASKCVLVLLRSCFTRTYFNARLFTGIQDGGFCFFLSTCQRLRFRSCVSQFKIATQRETSVYGDVLTQATVQ